jgi:PAS domain S-box-containing protein
MRTSGPVCRFNASTMLNYGIAILAVAVALAGGLLLQATIAVTPSVSLFLCAIMFAAWIGGTGAGLLAIALTVLAFDYFFLSPVYSFSLSYEDLPRLVLFAVAALFVVALSAAQRRTAESLRRIRDEQQETVRELRRVNETLRVENAERKRAEDALRQSEAALAKNKRELELTIDMIAAVVTCYRPDGERDFVNRPWRDYTGLTLADIQGERWRVVVHPDDWAESELKWRASLSTGEPFQFEQRLRRADGEFRWHMVRRVPLRDDQGDIIRWYGIGYDIEDQRRAEDAARCSEARLAESRRELQLTIDTIPALVATYRPDGSRESVNQTWRDYTGLSLDDAKGRSWSIIAYPGDTEASEQEWRICLATGKPFQMPHRLRRADGEYRWHMVRRVPLRDESGGITKWYAVGFDIEEQKLAEGALQRSEAYLAEAQRLSLTGSFGWVVASGDMFWSEETYHIMGVDRAARPSIDIIIERVHPDDRARVRHEFNRMMQGEASYDYEHRLLLPDGHIKHLLVRAHHVKYAAGKEEIVGAVMDVTESRKALEALHAAQAELAHASRVTTLAEMSASIAHEVNQPLAAIVTNGEACLRWLNRKTPDLDEVREAVDWIIKDGNRAGEVIRHIRALSNKSETHKAPLDINDTVKEAIALLQRELAPHRVLLRTELAPALPLVFADRVQLRQVIINLIMNSIEAMQPVEDRPRDLLIRSYEDDAHQVVVAVKDSGVGIVAESADRLFNAFFSTKPGGLGMGLSICRSIIEIHGGRLLASGHRGPGATFQFALPPQRENAP